MEILAAGPKLSPSTLVTWLVTFKLSWGRDSVRAVALRRLSLFFIFFSFLKLNFWLCS